MNGIDLRAAIYARYSSDQQNDRSIEDQVALCRQVAAREGLEVVQIFEDRAISGASAARLDYQQMVRAAESDQFGVLICEGTSRLGRRLADMAALHDRLKFWSVRLLTVQHGWMGELQTLFLGTMAQMQLTELREQTIRGQRGVVREGRIPGGLCYGYRAAAGGRPGEREVSEDEAAVIRRIYRDYAAGLSAAAIARALNTERVPGPRGGA
ncbi:recombinase family protein [Sabulicella rubraurantiaca]|uniref:recombinase family protein n=1 Tax=Sabulicella rubraurantiaca TaxID=2811429 RepID=UPI001A96E5BB|nr:recombinase family protein [Sabulicella rubraurantiaca]